MIHTSARGIAQLGFHIAEEEDAAVDVPQLSFFYTELRGSNGGSKDLKAGCGRSRNCMIEHVKVLETVQFTFRVIQAETTGHTVLLNDLQSSDQ